MPLPDGVRSEHVQTARLKIHVLRSGPDDGVPLLLIHGNVSSSRFWAELMAALPAELSVIAPDLRTYGATEPKPVDATRGVRDFADDIGALLDTLQLGTPGRPVHVVGWSVGGGVAMQLMLDRSPGLASVTLIAPMSPYGFGGVRPDGTLVWPDGAGAGGGLANPDFVARLGARDLSDDAETSPRNIMKAFYFHPSFALPAAREDAYVQAMVSTRVGQGFYPGDSVPSDHWPYVAPGVTATNNAISGRYADTTGIVDVFPKPPVLWVRGADDLIVSDHSMFDAGALGAMGVIPGWPGAEVFPPQPMVTQTRRVLERYQAAGGAFREEVFERCGHGPHVEHPDRFLELLLEHVRAAEEG